MAKPEHKRLAFGTLHKSGPSLLYVAVTNVNDGDEVTISTARGRTWTGTVYGAGSRKRILVMGTGMDSGESGIRIDGDEDVTITVSNGTESTGEVYVVDIEP